MKNKRLIFAIIASCIAAVTYTASDDCHKADTGSVPTEKILSVNQDSISESSQELSLPRPTNIINIPRTVTVSGKRQANAGTAGFSFIKDGKLLNNRSTADYLINLERFPSGLAEATHHLISLGKLVI